MDECTMLALQVLYIYIYAISLSFEFMAVLRDNIC